MIATTPEKSKRLLELGLDPNTADMVWMCNKWLYSIKDNILNQEQFSEQDTLAWSLNALLEVMPANIKIDDDQYFLYLEKDDGNIQGERYTCYYFSYYTCEVDNESALFSTASYDNAIDAAYEMVCWLLEQGLIKKGGGQ